MNKIVFVLAMLAAHSTWALQLKYIGETEIKLDTKYKDTVIGGLSALAYGNNSLYALSDDKGGKNEPRFYEFSLKIDKKNKVTIKPTAIHFITGLPDEDGKKAGMDPEGLARLESGNLFISSEGNNNAKPREMPRIFEVKPDGKWVSDVTIPDKYLPEKTGLQTKGTQFNQAFEGSSLSPAATSLFVSTEGALMQDTMDAKADRGQLIRLLRFEKKEDAWKPVQEVAYRMDPLAGNAIGPEVFSGVSEILALSDSKVIVMERGLRISPTKIYSNRVTLYVADLSKGTNTLDKVKLDDKVVPAEKTKLFDFETDLPERKKTVENFEGMAWGPTLPDGRKTLVMVVDNNFSKSQNMQFVVFAVEGE